MALAGHHTRSIERTTGRPQIQQTESAHFLTWIWRWRCKAHQPRLYRHHRVRFFQLRSALVGIISKITKDKTGHSLPRDYAPVLAPHCRANDCRWQEHRRDNRLAATLVSSFVSGVDSDFRRLHTLGQKFLYLESVNRVWAFGGWIGPEFKLQRPVSASSGKSI